MLIWVKSWGPTCEQVNALHFGGAIKTIPDVNCCKITTLSGPNGRQRSNLATTCATCCSLPTWQRKNCWKISSLPLLANSGLSCVWMYIALLPPHRCSNGRCTVYLLFPRRFRAGGPSPVSIKYSHSTLDDGYDSPGPKAPLLRS